MTFFVIILGEISDYFGGVREFDKYSMFLLTVIILFARHILDNLLKIFVLYSVFSFIASFTTACIK